MHENKKASGLAPEAFFILKFLPLKDAVCDG